MRKAWPVAPLSHGSQHFCMGLARHGCSSGWSRSGCLQKHTLGLGNRGEFRAALADVSLLSTVKTDVRINCAHVNRVLSKHPVLARQCFLHRRLVLEFGNDAFHLPVVLAIWHEVIRRVHFLKKRVQRHDRKALWQSGNPYAWCLGSSFPIQSVIGYTHQAVVDCKLGTATG